MKIWEWFKNLFRNNTLIDAAESVEKLPSSKIKDAELNSNENISSGNSDMFGRSNYKFDGKLIDGIPNESGVYMFMLNNQIQYIGQTNSFKRRISEHTFKSESKWKETISNVQVGKFSEATNYKEITNEQISNSGWLLFRLESDKKHLDEAESYLLKKYVTPFNKTENGIVSRHGKTYEIKLIKYNGAGIIKEPKNWEELKELAKWDDSPKTTAGISGTVPNVMPYEERKKFVKFLTTKKISTTSTRMKGIKLWIIGDKKTIGKKANEMIDKDDYVVMLSYIIDLMKENKMWNEYQEWKREQ